MTVPKKPTGAPSWTSPDHRLTPKARAALVDALGFPAESQDRELLACLRGVERWLGFFNGGVKAIDNAPSAAVYVRELVALKKAAHGLMILLNSPTKGINPFTRVKLDAHFEKAVSIAGSTGVANATSAAACVVGACHSALQDLESEKNPGRGRRKAGARNEVLKKLLELYGDYSKRLYEKRVRKGGVEALSDFEKHELAFVRAAFRDIKADPFHDASGDQKWLELIRPIRQASAKLRMRALQAVEPRQPKKAKPKP